MIPIAARSVMASRREPPDSLDFFPTPPWATRALLVHVLPAALDGMHIVSAWDPCCGEGHMIEVLAESITITRATDVFDYGRGYPVADFLDTATTVSPAVDLISMNPPFNAAADFVLRALDQASAVAVLVRTQWLEGEERYTRLLRDHPPTLYAPFVERVPMVKGRWDPKASTATAYAWVVWAHGIGPKPLFQIPPGCRRQLTRPNDAVRFGKVADAPLFDPAPSLMAAE